MATATKAILAKARLTEKGYTNGPTVRYTMESGMQVSNMGTGSGKASMEILTLVSGDSRRRKGTVCIFGKTEIDMRVSGSSA